MNEKMIVLESKIESITLLLDKLKQILQEHHKNKNMQEFLLYAAEKKAEEVVELAVSLNQEILQIKGKMGLSYYDSFIELKNFGLFTEEELRSLASTAGFRNRLAHEYLEIDGKIAFRTMENILVIYPPYLLKVKKILKKI
ncbi:DUF86 domain-containing protein [Candidatus Woesearchaeota archaeon]|nr:DUF86 domain-containing protein [Candidatus Woesearchaeota archaeon]